MTRRGMLHTIPVSQARAIAEAHRHRAPRVARLLGAGHPPHAALGVELEPFLVATLVQEPRFALEHHAALLAHLQLRYFQISLLPVAEAFYEFGIKLVVDVAHRFDPLIRGS